jgi:hypothetical protein
MSCQEEGRKEKKRKEKERKGKERKEIFKKKVHPNDQILLLFAQCNGWNFWKTHFSTMMSWMILVPVSDSNASQS